MSETNTYKGTLKVKKNYRPSFGDVFFAWVFFGLFRYWTYRFVFTWGIWGSFMYYFLLFSAISVTVRALFIPIYRYEFQREVEPESDPISRDLESTKTEESSSTEIKTPTPHKATPEKVIEKTVEESVEKPIMESKPEPEKPKPVDVKEKVEVKKPIPEGIQYCSYCGVDNPDYGRYCRSCGERLL